MADVITRLKIDSQEYEAKLKRATQSLAQMTQAAEKQGNKIATANQKNIQLAQSLGKMQTVASSVRGKMSELTTAFENATHSYNRLTAAEKNSPFGRALKTSVDQLQVRIRSLRQEMNATQMQLGKTGGMGGGIGAQFGAGLKSAAAMFGPTALAIGGVTAAIGGMKKVMGDMVRINMEFEQSTANLAAVMGTSRNNITALTEQAKKLGATTQYTAVQITELQTNLARLGFSEKEILNSTKSVQALATATGADLGEAANLAGAALRGFGMNATEMERVASVLAVSTTKSALSFEKLSTAIPIVAPVAKQFGFSIEDVTTLLGKLSDAGFDASSAATASRNIFLNLANANGKLAQALGRPVKSIEDLAPALVELKNKGIDLADMLALTDKRSVAAFATFMDSAETMTQFKESITNCSDALQGMVDEQLNTLQGSVTILKSSWEGLMLTFSEGNGVLKDCVDALSRMIQAYTEWRKRVQGGEVGIGTYEKGVTDEQKKLLDAQIAERKAAGATDEAIIAGSKKKLEAYKQQEAEMQKLLDLLAEADKLGTFEGRKKEEYIRQFNEGFSAIFKDYDVKKDGNANAYVQRQIAAKRDQQAQHQYVIDALTPSSSNAPAGGGSEVDAEKKQKKALARLKAQYEAQSKEEIAALDKVQMIKEGKEEEYEQRVFEIKLKYLKLQAGLYEEGTKERAQAEAAISALEISYQNTRLKFLKKEQTDERKEYKETEKEREAALRRQKQLDSSILNGLTGVGKKARWNASNLGLDGFKAKIDASIDITEEEWTAIQDKLNKRLKALGLDPIQINFETGNIEEVYDEIKAKHEKFISDLNSGIGAVSDIVSGLESMKNIGEELANVFNGEGDAIDGMFSIMKAGISTLQTVMSIYEALNTLMEIGTALKEAKAAADTAEATTAVTAATTEVAAEGEVAAASATTTGVKAGEAAAGAGEAMSGIPFVGPILAIAAIAAVLAAVLGAVKSAKSAKNSYATGGVVGGNSLSGDNVVSFLNSGEGVLTKQGIANAGEMLSQGGIGNLQLETKIHGNDLRCVLHSTDRSRGGSNRGAYAISKK
ncbi:MAG: phage tail tape measure protein [Paludibacteraceae bacterium]|nr:phage tail tape measure protein [Paludibacteraceae bacterium]